MGDGGALFLAVNPLLVTRLVFVLQEPTLMLFTTLAVLLSMRWITAPSTPRAALAGAVWGLCTLAKVVVWFVPLLMLTMRFLPSRLRWEWNCREIAALLLCFAAVIAPWTIRNYNHFGRFIPVNDEGKGILEWAVSNAVIKGETDGKDFLASLDAKGVQGTVRAELQWEYVWDHPRYFLLERIGKNIAHFAAPSRGWWIATGRAHLNEHGFLYWVLVGIFHVPLYLLLLYRTWRWARYGDGKSAGFPILFYWVYWAQYAVVYGDPRFGIPVLPLLVGIALPPAKTGGVGLTESELTGSTAL